MAEYTHFYATNDTAGTETATTWASATNIVSVAGTSLSASTKYLVVARMLFGSNSTTDKVHPTVRYSDDLLSSHGGWGAAFAYEMGQTGTTQYKSFFYVDRFTTPAGHTSTDNIEIRLPVDGSTGRYDQASLFVLDLDEIGTAGTDYFEDFGPTSGVYVSEGTELASIPGSSLGTDEYLILGSAGTAIDATNRRYALMLYTAMDASFNDDVARAVEEGEDTSEIRCNGFVGRHKASSGTPNAEMYGGLVSFDAHAAVGSYIIALPTSLFADFNYDYTDGSIDANPAVTVASIGAYTPSVNGNHLLVGHLESQEFWVQANNDVDVSAWNANNTTVLRTGDDSYSQNQRWDNSDIEDAQTFDRWNITGSVTPTLRGLKATGGANELVGDRWLVLVNLNEPYVPLVAAARQPYSRLIQPPQVYRDRGAV